MCWNRFATLAWVLFISLHFLCLIPGAVSCVINLEEVSFDDLLSARHMILSALQSLRYCECCSATL